MSLNRTASSIVPGKKQLSHQSFSIITITGHRQEQSGEAYDSGNEDEQRQLCNIIHSSTATLAVSIRERTSRVPLQPLNIQSTAAVSSGHIYNFHNCNVVIN